MTDMTRVMKWCDLCGLPLSEDEMFGHLTISTRPNLVTWDMHEDCAEQLNRELERRMAYTRGRRKENRESVSLDQQPECGKGDAVSKLEAPAVVGEDLG